MTNANHPALSSARLDYLDAVRAFALLLGIVFHASLSFLPIFIGWAVMDISTSTAVSVFALVSHAFRMEVFFLIAGFFSHMSFHRGGARDFLKTRLVRVGLPLVAGWFVLRPLLVGGWIMGGQSLRGEVDITGAFLEGFESLATLPGGFLVGTHLWFLYYLLLITTLTLVTRWILRRMPGLNAALKGSLDRATGWVSTSRLGILALAAPTAVCLWFMDGWGMDTPDQSLVPHLPVLAVYTLCFGLGWFLNRRASLMACFARLSAHCIVLAISAVLATVVLAGFQDDPGHPQFALFRLLFVSSYAVMMWALVVLCIGTFKRFWDRPSKTVRYLADASYWLYLVHLPLVIWLQIAVAELPFHWSLKITAIVGLTVGLGLLLYDGVVRSTVLGQVLNGRRKPRALTKRRAAEPVRQPSG